MLRSCLVHQFKHMFLVSKQHYTYFYILFYPHIFSHMFSVFKCMYQIPSKLHIVVPVHTPTKIMFSKHNFTLQIVQKFEESARDALKLFLQPYCSLSPYTCLHTCINIISNSLKTFYQVNNSTIKIKIKHTRIIVIYTLNSLTNSDFIL